MNYLKEIVAFSEYKSINPMSAGQISLWYTLMSINNKCGWREWFSVANCVLTLNSGLSVSGVRKCRIALKEMGLIDFRFKDKNATEYKMNSLIMFDKYDCVSEGLSNGLSNSPSNTLNKQKETKQNKTNYNNKKYLKKGPLNNYDDLNTSDYDNFDEEVLNRMLEEDA